MSTQDIFAASEQEFQKALEHLKEEFRRLLIGRASSSLVEHLPVEAYGTMQPLVGLSGISIPDPRTIQIQPWDTSILPQIEKAIRISDLGFNPTNDGTVIRISIPPLTEERRRDLAKLVHQSAEDARIKVRNARHHAYNSLRELEKSKEINEDELHRSEKKLQEKVDALNVQIDEIARKKEADIMSV